jgi:hypothetical protein
MVRICICVRVCILPAVELPHFATHTLHLPSPLAHDAIVQLHQSSPLRCRCQAQSQSARLMPASAISIQCRNWAAMPRNHHQDIASGDLLLLLAPCLVDVCTSVAPTVCVSTLQQGTQTGAATTESAMGPPSTLITPAVSAKGGIYCPQRIHCARVQSHPAAMPAVVNRSQVKRHSLHTHCHTCFSTTNGRGLLSPAPTH